jgi:imidazolonepropionase
LPRKSPSPYLLLTNIGQLLTLAGESGPRRGPSLKEIGLVKHAAVLCGGGKIIAAGAESQLRRSASFKAWLKKNSGKVRELDCHNGVVLPGFVDSHTHPVFAAPRLVDFEHRIAGASYQQIAAAGGGIRSSVAAVRKATRRQLAAEVLTAFRAMLEQGTTTVEAKSGYGLTAHDEIKSLEAIRDAASQWPGTVEPTLLAAHVVPPEFSGKDDEYVAEVCGKIIPRASKAGLARFVDVFCERGAFTLEQSEKIFAAARAHGLGTRAHVCQFTPSKLDTLLAHKPASLDHMDCAAPEEIATMSKTETVATLLPGANYFLGHPGYPDARKLIDSGVAVALATDYNPGTSPTPSMPFMISLACTHMKMSPEEAISASTVNGACALGLQQRKGSIETGKDADLAVFAVDDYREIAYWFAWNRCSEVIIAGQCTWQLS